GALAECEFKPARMKAALSSTMMATDLADYLVRRGASFREAHGAVGKLVRQCEEQKIEMTALPRSAFAEAHALFAGDVADALSAQQSVEQREVDGGSGPRAVRSQIEAAQTALNS